MKQCLLHNDRLLVDCVWSTADRLHIGSAASQRDSNFPLSSLLQEKRASILCVIFFCRQMLFFRCYITFSVAGTVAHYGLSFTICRVQINLLAYVIIIAICRFCTLLYCIAHVIGSSVNWSAIVESVIYITEHVEVEFPIFKVKQESCAVAKMTARCALHK